MTKNIKIIGLGLVIVLSIYLKFVRQQGNNQNLKSDVPEFNHDNTKELDELLKHQEQNNSVEERVRKIDEMYSETKKWDREDAERRNLVQEILENNGYESSDKIPDDNISQPVNGFSPYDSYFGKGKYDYNALNTMIVHTPSSSNIVFLLKDVYSGRTIRNEYIRKNSTFKLTNIPYGTYTFTYFSGKNWSEYKILKNGKIKGGFTKNISFSKSDKVKDWMQFKEGYQGQWELTLTQVAGGNLDTESTNEEDFFK
tara:strand:+ start:2436 stop:3200 length:765 start_codon:yes stop_codon:yes gene_type:complete